MWTKKRAISIPSGGLTYNAVALQNRYSGIYAVAVVWCVLWKFYEAVVVFSLCGCEGGWSGGGMGALCPG